ncbi:hypothetical protein DXG03_002825, partial [Asterophora parasitica]
AAAGHGGCLRRRATIPALKPKLRTLGRLGKAAGKAAAKSGGGSVELASNAGSIAGTWKQHREDKKAAAAAAAGASLRRRALAEDELAMRDLLELLLEARELDELEARDFEDAVDARDFDEDLHARDFDEDLYARDFDEGSLYTRAFEVALDTRSFDDEELFARDELLGGVNELV